LNIGHCPCAERKLEAGIKTAAVNRKPNSVSTCASAFRPTAPADDDHSSSPAITGGIKRPTRKLRTGRSGRAPLFGLAPCGV